jgi:TolB-like protein
LDGFFERLKQRKLVQWALAYAAAAFALIQVIDIVGQRFGWPEGVVRGLIVALAIGFFVTIVLAWYHGERGVQRVTGTELLILALLLAIGGGLLWRYASKTPELASTDQTQVAPAQGRNSIAVLPFTDLSQDHDQEYFSDGMAEEILNALAQVPGLKVAGRTSSFFYKGKNENLQTIGRTLGVAHILEGSVRKQGDRVRITAQLIQASDDSHLWSHEYDGTLSDVFELQERIARAITEQLKLVLEGGQKARPATNGEAYQQFLRGEYFWHQRGYENLQNAVTAFKAALAIDPDYADAWAGLAQDYAILPEYYVTNPADTGDGPDTTQLALDAADHALKLDPQSSAALLARAYIRGARQFDWAGSEADFRTVLAANPQNATAHQWYGEILLYEAKFSECDAQFEATLAIDPLSAIGHHLRGYSLGMQANFAAALPHFEEALRLAPRLHFAAVWRTLSLSKLGRFDDAQKSLADVSEGRRKSFSDFIVAMRDPTKSDAAAAEIVKDPPDDILPPLMLMMLGRKEQTLDALEVIFRAHAPFRAYVYANRLFDPLREEPRFKALMRQVNLPPSSP